MRRAAVRNATPEKAMQYPQNFPPGQYVVLVADDDHFICQLIRATLEAVGYFVLTASDGEQALKISRLFPGTIHVLVSDIVMPKIDGLALREQILRERPAIQVMLMSGQTDRRFEDAGFLPKPFKPDDLKERVRQLLELLPQTGGRRGGASGPSRDHSMIEKRLFDDLNQAIAQHRRAQNLEIEIIKEVPSGIPASDGVTRILQARKVTRAAFEQYLQALRRYRNFKDQGVVPEDVTDE
jgi:CheY-like chemotaxis protein